MVAALSLTIALAVMGCSQKQESTTEVPPPEQSTMPADTGMAADTSMSHMGADTSMHK
jgi:hypothetical protein